MSKEEKRTIFKAISKMSEEAQVALAAGLAIEIAMDGESDANSDNDKKGRMR